MMNLISRIRRNAALVSEVFAIGQAFERGQLSVDQASRRINAVGQDSADWKSDTVPADWNEDQLAGAR